MKNITDRFTHLYILALTAVAIFAVFGQSAIQYALTSQINASGIVNMAGRQRMLSQRITKDLLLLTDQTHKVDKIYYLNDLEQTLPIWENCHEGLKEGVLISHTKIVVQKSAVLDSMLTEIDPVFHTLYRQAIKVNKRIKQGTYAVDDTISSAMQTVLAYEPLYLKRQDTIVAQFDKEAKAKIEQLKALEYYLLIFTIIILLLEGFFVFRPAVKHLRKTFVQLLREESKTKRINEKLIETNESLKKAELSLVKAEKEKYQQQVNEQRMRSVLLIQGQEEERNRISKELHDGLGQLLTTLKLTFENINTHSFSSEKEYKSFQSGKALIQDTINEVRNISFNLMPSVLSDFGIASALKLLCDQTSRNKELVVFDDSNWISLRLDRNIEIGLYRIAQEALNNAIKYSQASDIQVELSLKNETIELSIIDNGIGFQRNENNRILDSRRNGISNMEERAEMIGGFLKIVTNTGKGTKVYAKVPLKHPAHE